MDKETASLYRIQMAIYFLFRFGSLIAVLCFISKYGCKSLIFNIQVEDRMLNSELAHLSNNDCFFV